MDHPYTGGDRRSARSLDYFRDDRYGLLLALDDWEEFQAEYRVGGGMNGNASIRVSLPAAPQVYCIII
jgi:hypothetical protein